MLHGTIINFRRRIVNQTLGFSCRAAAQFNKALHLDAGHASGFRALNMFICPLGCPRPPQFGPARVSLGRWAAWEKQVFQITAAGSCLKVLRGGG